MNCNLSIPDDTIKKFKCSNCNNALSYFPISLTEDNKNVCGRCLPNGQFVLHNKIFEEIAGYIKFPCRFEEHGCDELLLPKSVPFHEENCNFKPVKCPKIKSTTCSWQGVRNDILSHCRRSHKDMFLKDNTFKLDSKASFFIENYLEHDGTLFVVSIGFSCDSQTLSFVIFHVEEDTDNSENYPFQVVLNRDRKRIIVDSVTTSFSEQEQCEIALDSLAKNNNDLTSQIMGYITFDISNDVPSKRFKKDLLSQLKCPKCDAYMLPPIDQFENNKTKCTSCSSVKELKLFDVNSLAETLEYPCKYEKNGCEDVLKSEKMKKHVPICSFANENCLFCDWKGLKMEVFDHIVRTHGDKMVESGHIFSVKNKKCASLKRVVRYGNRLFLLKFWIDQFTPSNGLYYKWIVASLSNDDEEFRYRIDIYNNKGCTSIQRTCVSLSQYLQEKNEHACVGNSFFFQLQYSENVIFKVCILK